MGLAPGALGVPWAGGGILKWSTSRGSWVDLLLKAQSRQQEMHSFFDILIGLLPSSLSRHNHASPSSEISRCWGELGLAC